jgi:hypothetical protein
MMLSKEPRKAKQLKREQHSVRDVRNELDEEERDTSTKPIQRQYNRDRARGDWDRSTKGKR